MSRNMTSIAVGDWVHSYSPGIWQVFRILEGVQELRFSPSTRKRPRRQRVIFCKRLVDDSWSPAFAAETCAPVVVEALSRDERARLDEFISKNPDVARRFATYEPEDLDCSMVLMLSVPPSMDKESLEGLVGKVFRGMSERGLTENEILRRLDVSPLGAYLSQSMINATLRFVCKNHELRGKEYLFRNVELIMM